MPEHSVPGTVLTCVSARSEDYFWRVPLIVVILSVWWTISDLYHSLCHPVCLVDHFWRVPLIVSSCRFGGPFLTCTTHDVILSVWWTISDLYHSLCHPVCLVDHFWRVPLVVSSCLVDHFWRVPLIVSSCLFGGPFLTCTTHCVIMSDQRQKSQESDLGLAAPHKHKSVLDTALNDGGIGLVERNNVMLIYAPGPWFPKQVSVSPLTHWPLATSTDHWLTTDYHAVMWESSHRPFTQKGVWGVNLLPDDSMRDKNVGN